MEEASGRPTLKEDCGRHTLTDDCGRHTLTEDRGWLIAFARSKCGAEERTKLPRDLALLSVDSYRSGLSNDLSPLSNHLSLPFMLSRDLFMLPKDLFLLSTDLGVRQRSSKDRNPFSRDRQSSPDEEDDEYVQAALPSMLLSVL